MDTTRGAPASTGPMGSIREASSCAAPGATRAKSAESSLRSLTAGLAPVSRLPGSQTPPAAQQRGSLGAFGAGAELEAASKLPQTAGFRRSRSLFPGLNRKSPPV